MAKVLNKYKSGIPRGAVYIGRGSKWGNPFRIGPDGSRADVIEKYSKWFEASGLRSSLIELKDKDLVCFCAPQACHGDFLLEQAYQCREVGA